MSDAPQTPGIENIGQISIHARDVAVSTRFYRDILGLRHLFSVGDKMSFFDCGGVRLLIDLPSSPEFDHLSSIMYFRVPDIDRAYAALLAQSVPIVRPPALTAKMPDHELWMCFYRDPADNVGALMSEKRPQ